MDLNEVLMLSKYYTTEWQLRMLSNANSWFLDTQVLSFAKQRPSSSVNLFVILCQDPATQVIIPCFFGMFVPSDPAFSYEIYARLLRVMLLKSPVSLDPLCLVVGYDDDLRRAALEIFPRANVISSFVHRARYLWNICRGVKCSMLGIKTAALTRMTAFFVSFILVISLQPPKVLVKHWQQLKQKVDTEAFKEVIASIERDFISGRAKYHKELSFLPFITEKSFIVSCAAIEGYHYRIKQLIKTYNVASAENLADKVLITEEKHFSSKVAEINLGRIVTPELPEKFFFERSMGSLPISNALADINSLKNIFDPVTLAELLVEQNDNRTLPQRQYSTSLCDLDGYNKSLIFVDTISHSVVSSLEERRKKHHEERMLRMKEEEDTEMQLDSDQI
mmetsp:Transcript_34142/g.59614  ORF Transcript_34142/g.59614 Transcript_34142/m.59614 type:complete len:392 (+) Transcript_34142:2116-3291(+)